MSNSFIELELFENINNLSNFYPDQLNFSNISKISKSKFNHIIIFYVKNVITFQ